MLSVLVIDDEQLVSSMVKAVLVRSGFNVETAQDGEEGIQKFDNGSFDLVITDIVMPGIDGNRVARYIRNSTRNDTPIIGMSGTPWVPTTQAFDKVLSKPFHISTLIDSVNQLAMIHSSEETAV